MAIHQPVERPIDIGDRVEVIGRLLHHDVMEYDGCEAIVLGVFSDSKNTRCATVKTITEDKGRAGKRYFPCRALKKLPPKKDGSP